MKKILMSAMAIALGSMAFVSCSSDVEETAGKQVKNLTFEVSVDGQNATRTVLDGNKVLFEEGDHIGVYSGSYTETSTSIADFTVTEGGDHAMISGTAPEQDVYYAVYPNDKTYFAIASKVINVNIPDRQKAVKDGFDPNANVMLAKSKGTRLEFNQVCAYAKVTVSQACKQIGLGGTAEPVAGRARVIYNDAFKFTEVQPSASDTKPYILLQPASGETFEAGTYYIAFRPATYTGFKISCVHADGTSEYKQLDGTHSVVLETPGAVIDFGQID